MPTVTFDERTVSDLALLQSLPVEAVGEFARIASDFTLKGARPKQFERAAGALGVDADAVQHCVAAIARIFMDCSKDQLNSKDFKTSVGVAELPAEAVDVLAAHYKASSGQLRERAREGSTQLPSLVALDWRLDVELSRRGAHHTMAPSYLLRVDSKAAAAAGSAAAPSSVYLQADYASMKHLQSALSSALQESTTTHADRVSRYIR